MIKKWWHKLFKTEAHEGIETPVNESARFVLAYDDLEIGTLMLNEGEWVFAYSEAFKNQTKVNPLVNFPSKEKIYRSTELWPFFLHRIPGLGQPRVQNIIRKEQIDPGNAAALLRRFGERTITNPFRLRVG
ncbi:MAG: HipA N-terminal domain-containing protein [Bacteroidia bacterium]|nr:HipA N-terminal domain-containing protein [Bacteroidia bacterium]